MLHLNVFYSYELKYLSHDKTTVMHRLKKLHSDLLNSIIIYIYIKYLHNLQEVLSIHRKIIVH